MQRKYQKDVFPRTPDETTAKTSVNARLTNLYKKSSDEKPKTSPNNDDSDDNDEHEVTPNTLPVFCSKYIPHFYLIFYVRVKHFGLEISLCFFFLQIIVEPVAKASVEVVSLDSEEEKEKEIKEEEETEQDTKQNQRVQM